MKFEYIPTRLIKAREQVAIKHPLVTAAVKLNPDDKLKRLVLKIVNLDDSGIEMIAFSLTNCEISLLTSYIPLNYYNVKLDNLFKVLLLRSSIDIFRLFYYQWQESYNNEECNHLIEIYLKKNRDYQEVMKNNNLPGNVFFTWLKANMIPNYIGHFILDASLPEDYTFPNKLEHFGIQNGSKLWNDIRYLFYTFCNKEDYLAVMDAELLSIVRQYQDADILREFLRNFLDKLEPKELDKYERIANFFDAKIGENYGVKFREFFADFRDELVDKYVDWMNAFKLSLYFGNDERSVFWKRYKHRTVKKFLYTNLVVMEFDDYYAIEFLGQANGPAYIYEKEYYSNNIRKNVEGRFYNKTDLKHFLYHRTSYQNEARWIKLRGYDGTRLVHNPNPGWQRKFGEVIRNEKITGLRKI